MQGQNPELELEAEEPLVPPRPVASIPSKPANPARKNQRDRTKDQLCPFCGSLRMDRQHKEDFIDVALAIVSGYTYRCRKCLRTTTKFFLTWRVTAVALFVSLAVGASIWAVNTLYALKFAPKEGASHVEAADGVRSNMGQLSPFEKMMLAKHQQTLDNDTIVRLTKSNISSPIILKMMRSSNHDFDVSANAIIALKNAGVDEAVIFTMLDLSSDPK